VCMCERVAYGRRGCRLVRAIPAAGLWQAFFASCVVYYESLKRTLKTKTIYGYRCDERLKSNVEESTRLACTPLCAELEHLKIETRLTSETPVSEMGEYPSVM
jgi:hypothetical protein